MLKLTITIEENDSGIGVIVASGADAECKKASDREYSLGNMLANAVKGISPVLASASEYEEVARMAAPMLKSFEKATEKMFGKNPKDMFLAAKEAKERGEDIGDWLNKLAKDHAAETAKDEAPADETKDAKPEAEPEG